MILKRYIQPYPSLPTFSLIQLLTIIKLLPGDAVSLVAACVLHPPERADEGEGAGFAGGGVGAGQGGAGEAQVEHVGVRHEVEHLAPVPHLQVQPGQLILHAHRHVPDFFLLQSVEVFLAHGDRGEEDGSIVHTGGGGDCVPGQIFVAGRIGLPQK